MSTVLTRVGLLAALLALSACSGDGGGEISTPSGDALAQSLILDTTTDSAEPVEINDLDLDFGSDGAAFSAFFE
jgi:ABC-type glycerol-3-phosphate transport system substrate-binding protein